MTGGSTVLDGGGCWFNDAGGGSFCNDDRLV
jgi:hypothetical protein